MLNKDTNTLTQFHESLKKVKDTPSVNPYSLNDIENGKKMVLSNYNAEIVEQNNFIYYDLKKDTYAIYIVKTLKDEKDAQYVDVVEV